MLTRTARGAGWVIGWRMTTRLLGIASTLLLVRLLVPADFGLIALAVGFSQAIDQLSAVGVDEALMRVKSPAREVYDTAFTINMLRGFGTTVVLLAAAYPVAVFFKEPRLVEVFFALAGGCFVMSFENIAVSDFRRDMAFRKEFQLLIVPRIINIIVAATAAILLRNYWALVWGMMTTQVLRIAMGYVMHPYRPRLTLRAWRQLAGFSAWNWAISVAVLVGGRVDSFVIARVLNSTALGIYGVGTEIALTPTQELIQPLSRACFSSFVAARHSGLGPEEAYFRIISSMALFIFPAALRRRRCWSR
jgi:O-antigen/teichoic acid export membrane protein